MFRATTPLRRTQLLKPALPPRILEVEHRVATNTGITVSFVARSTCLSTFFSVLKPSRKLALLIGNDKYPGSELTGAANDAKVLGQRLKKLAFEVSKYDFP